jgi:hypothetical protein
VPQDLVGRSLARCRITGQLGSGGMGEPYRARDTDRLLVASAAGEAERAPLGLLTGWWEALAR